MLVVALGVERGKELSIEADHRANGRGASSLQHQGEAISYPFCPLTRRLLKLGWKRKALSVTEQGLVCPWHRKPNSDSRCLRQSKGLFAGRQASRMGSLCSKDPNSRMAFRQGFLKTVLEERVVGCVISSCTFF